MIQKTNVFIVILLVSIINIVQINAQPPGITLNANVNSSSMADNTINISSQPEWINCDVYNDGSGSTNYPASIIAWDEYNSGVWSVKIFVKDHFSNTTHTYTINDAKHPDVAILDVGEATGMGAPGFFVIAVVYEDVTTNEIKFDYYDVGSFMGNGSVPGFSSTHGPWTISGSNPAMYPHIDGFRGDPSSSIPYYTGVFNGYTPLNHFVITWTENNSGTSEIFITDGYFDYISLFPNPIFSNNTTYVADGNISDVAGVRFFNSFTNTNRYAYILYKDGNDLYEADYDIDNSTVDAINLLDNDDFIGIPRIDASNIYGGPAYGVPYYYLWNAIAQVRETSPTRNYVKLYDSRIATTPLKNHVYDPTNTNLYQYDMYAPSIAMGPGEHAPYAGTGIPLCGEHVYMPSMLFDDNNSSYLQYASGQNHLNGTMFNGFVDISQGPLDNTIDHILATSFSPNIGVSYLSAWNNLQSGQHQIQWKLTDCGGNFQYKPEKPSAIEKIGNNVVIISPNPATTVINVTGVKDKATYTITDVTGRLVQQGSVSDSNAEVNIANLVHGMYILNFDENGNQQQFKLIKQ